MLHFHASSNDEFKKLPPHARLFRPTRILGTLEYVALDQANVL
jgi:hypothetical protein